MRVLVHQQVSSRLAAHLGSGLPRRVTERIFQSLTAVTTPLLPTDYADLIAPLHSPGNLRGRITHIRRDSSVSTTLRIKPGLGWITHTPGQFVQLGVDINGVRHWRAYSIISAPKDPEISITVTEVDGGLVSGHLAKIPVGTVVELRQAAGEFIAPPPEHNTKLAFLCAGAGITPAVGILTSLTHNTEAPTCLDAVVVHSSRTPSTAVLADTTARLARVPGIDVMSHYSAHHGRLTPRDIHLRIADLDERTTFICGPESFISSIEAYWNEAGLKNPLLTERFRLAPLASDNGRDSGGTATFRDTAVEVPAGTTILEAAEASGKPLESGCRMGVCFGCLVPLTEGSVRDVRNGDITTAQRGESTTVQPCVTTTIGSCTFDI